MPALEFVDQSDDILRTPVDPKDTRRLTKADRKALSNIEKTMAQHPDAIAIAGPQVDVSLRAFALRSRSEMNMIVNPRFLWTSIDDPDEILMGPNNSPIPRIWTKWERCLSIPGKEFLVSRPYLVVVAYSTPKGRERRRSLDGWLARIFCHEIDHLDGILVPEISQDSRDIDPEATAERAWGL